MVNIWNDLHKHNGHHVPHTFTPPGTHSAPPAEFLPIRGLGAIAIVLRGRVVLWAQHTPVCCLGMYAESFI